VRHPSRQKAFSVKLWIKSPPVKAAIQLNPAGQSFAALVTTSAASPQLSTICAPSPALLLSCVRSLSSGPIMTPTTPGRMPMNPCHTTKCGSNRSPALRPHTLDPWLVGLLACHSCQYAENRRCEAIRPKSDRLRWPQIVGSPQSLIALCSPCYESQFPTPLHRIFRAPNAGTQASPEQFAQRSEFGGWSPRRKTC
jgi:hypothetical protein